MHLQAAPTGMVERWLTDALTAIPKTPGHLLGDALPSLLASRDPRVLRLMVNTSYSPDRTVAAYAANSLELFDPVEMRTELLSALRQRGPNEALGYMFGSRGNIVAPIAAKYLRDILASSQQTWVRTAAAQGLVQLNDHAGWVFFIGVVEQRPFYRDEMVRWLGDQFPAIQNAVDPQIIRFLKSKLASATGEE